MQPQLRLVPQKPHHLIPHLDAFLLAQEASHHTVATREFYSYTIGPFITYLSEQGIEALDAITPTHIRGYLISLEKRGCKDTTQHDHARGIKAWLNWLVTEGELSASPMAKVKMPKREGKILPALTPDELRILLDACPKTAIGLRDKAILLGLLDSGLRASEFTALSIGSMDTKTGLCKVHGKGHKERVVRFGARTRLALSRYLATRVEARPGDPLWTAYDWRGEPTP
jgi:integrase/recombinase XerC